MSKYHVIIAASAFGQMGLIVVPHERKNAENNTLRLPKDVTTVPFADLVDIKFTPGITDYEEARRAVIEVLRATVVEVTPDEVTAASLQPLPNILTPAQISAIKAGWLEPSVFRTVYLREGDSNVFTRFANQTLGRLHGPARADSAVIAVYDGDRNKNAAGLSSLTSAIVINAQPGEDDIIKAELKLALSRNNHIVVESVTAVAESSRLDVIIEQPSAAA